MPMLSRVSVRPVLVGGLTNGALRHTATGTSFHPRELCWPDADPTILQSAATGRIIGQSSIVADDVSGTHATVVHDICSPRCAADVQAAVLRARREGRTVCVRGTQHSMGGHSISPGGIVVDLKHFVNVTVSDDRTSVTCGPGAMWLDLIRVLNPFGKSPVSMQSYCSFSVGGTLSVNGHGITTDNCVADSVLEMTVVLPDGSLRTCRRGCKDTEELFSLVLGGYGLFGIIVSITMRVAENYALSAESFPVSAHDFPFVYKGALRDSQGQDGTIAVKLARLDITSPDRINMYIFRKRPFSPTTGSEGAISGIVGDLDTKDEGMGTIKRLLYKWLAPPLQEIRYQLETQYGAALDWEDALDKNSLMYQTARPLAQLSEPIYLADDTFILQEYFIPYDQFTSFIAQIKPIYSEIISAGGGATMGRADGGAASIPTHVHLLNTTIRYVHKDVDTALPYSQSEGGSFAFVLYYRLARNPKALSILEKYHSRLTDVALSLGGTFFLPYQHHYTEAQLQRAYPMFNAFIDKKVQRDPEGIFDSCWFRRYGLDKTPPKYQALFAARDQRGMEIITTFSDAKSDCHVLPKEDPSPTEESTCITIPPLVSEHRTDSFSKLMRCNSMRCAFRDKFLKHVFEVAQSAHLFGIMSRLQYDVRCETDVEVYVALGRALDDETSAAGVLMKEFRKVLQASRQKSQLARETHRLLSRLGLVGKLNGYVSVGDYGRMILPFHEALHLPPGGAVYVVHDDPGDAYSLAAAVERGCADPLGVFARIDYNECRFPSVPSDSCDLLTMNQGLHHLPQDRLATFLGEVTRVLRPGGVFIVREHDATPDLIPMLDMAHFVFNSVMGVPSDDEHREVRAFRPIEEWRRIIPALTNNDLTDTQLYEFQDTDPTLDVMMAYRKKGTLPTVDTTSPTSSHPRQDGSIEKEMLKAHPFYKTFMELPRRFQSVAVSGLGDAAGFMDVLSEAIGGSVAPSGHEDTLTTLIGDVLQPWQSVLLKLQVMLANATPRSPHLYDAIPIEIFVVFRLLERKVADKKATAVEALAVTAIHELVRKVILPTPVGVDDEEVTNSNTEESSSSNSRTSRHQHSKGGGLGDDIADLLADLVAVMPHLLHRSYLQDHAKVPSPIVDTIQGLVPGGFLSTPTEKGRRKVAATLTHRFTTHTLEDVKAILGRLLVSKTPLTFDALLCRDGDLEKYHAHHKKASSTYPPAPLQPMHGLNDWALLMLVLMGDSHVKLTSTVTIAARFYGFSDIVDVRETAQAIRALRWGSTVATATADDTAHGPPSSFWSSSAEQRGVSDALQRLEGEVKYVKMTGDSQVRNIHDVASILNASYQGKDVTEIMRLKLFDRNINQVTLEGVELDDVFQFGLTPFSKYVYGARVISITYKTSESYNPSSMIPLTSAKTVMDSVPLRNLISSSSAASRGTSAHNDKTEATLFKFAEWMQVHILEELASSLYHTPWYRYPFLGTIRQYASVVAQLSKRVRMEKGASVAYTSMHSITATIPGVVMGLLFSQLQLLALPLLQFAGKEYDSNRLLQQVLIYVPDEDITPTTDGEPSSSSSFLGGVGDKVLVTPISTTSPHLFTLTVPPFEALTQTLVEVLRYNDHVIPISIEGHSRVNVHIRCLISEGDQTAASEALENVANQVGGELVVDPFQLGSFANASLLLPVVNLGRLVKVCSLPHHTTTTTPIANLPINAVSIKAIYDFY